MKLSCPVCGFRTLSDKAYGSYEICPVCGWEDDAVQLANPCSGGGANRESLHESQRLAQNLPKESVIGFKRDPEWRPLNEEEVAYYQSAKAREHWTFQGETEPDMAYWRKDRSREIANVVRDILDGKLGIVVGARKLSRLRYKSQIETDQDILFFIGIDSETDGFPVGDVRRHWNAQALRVKDEELEQFESRVREKVFEACKRLLMKLQHLR